MDDGLPKLTIMNLNLAEKVALVTGSSRGIGKEIASALYEENCRVVFNSTNPDCHDELINDFPGAIFLSGNATKEGDAIKLVQETTKHFGQLDILVCNVGSGRSSPPGEETSSDWKQMMDINLYSAVNMVSAAKSALAESNGSIVCISSICAHEVIPGAPIGYSTAKAALNAYIKSSSRSLAKLGIRINGVSPGNINFPGSVWDSKMQNDPNGVKNFLADNVPLARLGTPAEVANLVTYLSSSKSDFVSGSIWTIDGGQIRS